MTSRQIIVALIAASLLLMAVSYPWHRNLLVSYISLVVLIVAIAIAAFLYWGENTRESFSAAAALFSILAVLFGSYWYFFDRPSATKLDLGLEAAAIPIGDGQALVRVDLTRKNVGTTVINFRHGSRGSLEIGRMAPMAPADKQRILADFGGQPRSGVEPIAQVDDWPLLAQGAIDLEGSVEAGETDHLYFRSFVPCKDGMILVAQVSIPKTYTLADRVMGNRNDDVIVDQVVMAPVSSCTIAKRTEVDHGT